MHGKTEEEKLQAMITYLKVAFERDIRKNKLNERVYEENEELKVKYSDYCERLEELSKNFLGTNPAYRRLMCMPSFVLSLVMASRVRRHYIHAPWFRVTSFNKMLDVHGGVSEIGRDLCLPRPGWYADERARTCATAPAPPRHSSYPSF